MRRRSSRWSRKVSEPAAKLCPWPTSSSRLSAGHAVALLCLWRSAFPRKNCGRQPSAGRSCLVGALLKGRLGRAPDAAEVIRCRSPCHGRSRRRGLALEQDLQIPVQRLRRERRVARTPAPPVAHRAPCEGTSTPATAARGVEASAKHIEIWTANDMPLVPAIDDEATVGQRRCDPLLRRARRAPGEQRRQVWQ